MTFRPALRKTGVCGLVALSCVSGTPLTETFSTYPPLSNKLTNGCARPVAGFKAHPAFTVAYDLPLAPYSSVPSGLKVLPTAQTPVPPSRTYQSVDSEPLTTEMTFRPALRKTGVCGLVALS